MKKIAHIKVPSRGTVPETTIYTHITYESEESLKTKPYLLMIPGGPGANHSNYSDYDCLQEKANIIYYDPRGCGLSAKGDPSTYTMDNNIDDIHHIIRELNLDQVIVLGKSCGAMHALGFTIRYPDQVSRLILAAGAPSHAFLETGKSIVLEKGTEEQIKVCETLWSGSFKNQEEVDHYFSVMKPFYSWKIRHNEPVDRPAPLYPYSFDALNQGFRTQVWRFDFQDQLSTVQCPTLVLVGEEDWITSPVYSKQMAEGIPNSKLIIFEQSDHSMESDVPEQYFGAINTFIPSLPLEKNPDLLFFKEQKDSTVHDALLTCSP
ncbi:alpha/beta fold hydrolase [Legionella sp. km535]|uniref:alpha/beta fold hydrolase n=1 Tax=Legionella sp. km535 TaxID=2498107 RepID=UPI000F8E8208|nr:alpha/beta hydrolase [Legionella sp. km535]RUR19303.1 alpha/beta fold hydrolase [Legionella sp. km535]